jgi:hypothetical protein
MIRKYIEKIGENRNVDDMQKLGDMLSEIIYETKDSHPEIYHKYKMELYEMAYGKKISEEMAENWVKDMKPIGIHWTIDETTNAMQSLGYNFDKIDFYVVANMMYNDYFDLVKDDETLALKLAKDWLSDEDAKEDKLYCYWKYIVD